MASMSSGSGTSSGWSSSAATRSARGACPGFVLALLDAVLRLRDALSLVQRFFPSQSDLSLPRPVGPEYSPAIEDAPQGITR